MTEQMSDDKSTAPRDIRLGLVDALSKSKPPVLQYKNGLWFVWTAYNAQLTQGTCIALHHDGTMERLTHLPDGSVRYNTL